jgi:hypothetical protein
MRRFQKFAVATYCVFKHFNHGRSRFGRRAAGKLRCDRANAYTSPARLADHSVRAR